LIGTTNTLMAQGIAALVLGLLHWRHLHREKIREGQNLLLKKPQYLQPVQA